MRQYEYFGNIMNRKPRIREDLKVSKNFLYLEIIIISRSVKYSISKETAKIRHETE